MWLFTRYGFYSIACARKPDGSPDPGLMMVRARVADHLASLQKRFPSIADVQLVTLVERDYRYRLIVPKDVWVPIVTELAEEQTWSNFKSEVEDYQGEAGSDYSNTLHRVWHEVYQLQKKRH